MKETEQPYLDLIERMYSLTELRMQKIKPAQPNYYRKNMQDFWATFSQKDGVNVRKEYGSILVGDPSYFDLVSEIVKAEIEKVHTISGITVEPFFIFIGDGETMNRNYRRIDNSPPPYPFAISGALDCYLNTDYFKQLGIDHPAVRRAISHEPRHTAWNLVLKTNGQPTFQTDRNKVIREALGGPLDPGKWADIQDLPIPLDDINTNIDFYGWLTRKQEELKYGDQYFINPIVKAFYKWAESKGDEKFWFTEAQKIPNQ